MTQLTLIPDAPPAPEDLVVELLALADLPPDADLPGDAPATAFVDSIRRFGLLQPIVVVPNGAGYKIAAGRRRTKAARAAGLSQIPAVIYPPGYAMPQVIALIENQQRSRNIASDYLAIRKLADQGASESDIVAATGMPLGTIRARLRLSNLIPPLHEAFLAGCISATVADHASALSHDLQEQLAARLATAGKLTAHDIETVRHVAQTAAAAQLATLSPQLFATPGATSTTEPQADALAALQLARGIVQAHNLCAPSASETERTATLDRLLDWWNYIALPVITGQPAPDEAAAAIERLRQAAATKTLP